MLNIHDIHCLMANLSRQRPIFHSEADFQHALAWQIHRTIPNCEIRLEMPYRVPQGNWYLDIWLQTMEIAIELKYRTKRMEGEKDGEYFLLKNHSGYPQGRYDFLKDIQRLEQVVADRKAKSGFAVLLTNDLNFWQQPQQRWETTNDANFRLHEGRTLTGELTWSEQASDGTMRTKEGKNLPIHLKGSYHLQWQEYSHWGEQAIVWLRQSSFRYLAVLIK